MSIPEEMKAWIDGASYEELLARWRFAPAGSPWFRGEVGDYYVQVMQEKGEKLSEAEQVAVSKRIGWDKR